MQPPLAKPCPVIFSLESGWLLLQPQRCIASPRAQATAVTQSCLWTSLQTVQQVQQLEADLQDARQAKEQAELERDGAVADSDSAVAEGVRQRDEWENTMEDLVKERETFKAEAAVSQLSL